MESVWPGIAVGVAMIVINGIVNYLLKKRNQDKEESATTAANKKEIKDLKEQAEANRELIKHTLGMTIIIGDGMIQSGVNGDVKLAFNSKKQEALKLL